MMFRTPPIVKNLLIINIIFFMAQMLLPIGDSLTDAFALHYWESPNFQIYQFVTYMFLHGSIGHLFFNMFALWMFGRIAEYDLGSRRFLSYYVITGICAGLFHMGVMELEFSGIKSAIAAFKANPLPTDFTVLMSKYFPRFEYNEAFIEAWAAAPTSNMYVSEAVKSITEIYSMSINSITVGASGAVFGVLLAFGLMHPNDRIMLLIPPIPIKAKYFVMGYAAIELISGIGNSSSTVAHFAHLGGMVAGWIILRYWKKKGIIRY